MKSDLRNLVTAQEAYFSDNNNRYASAIALLRSMYKPSDGVEVTLDSTVANGWKAHATHRDLPRVVCTMEVGSGSTTEGVPLCDELPTP